MAQETEHKPRSGPDRSDIAGTRGGEDKERMVRNSRQSREQERPEEKEQRIRHLFEAAEHLEMAGLGDESRRFREMAHRMMGELHQHRENRQLEQIHRELRGLQEAVKALREQNEMLRKHLENRKPE